MRPVTFFLILSILFMIVAGCKKTDSSDPVVKDPYAMFRFTKKANGIVSFSNTSTDATSFLWDFGDLTTSTSSATTIDHQYLQNGTYKATLTAYGNGKSTGAYADLNITTVIGSLPTVETNSITNITQTTATSGGNVTSDGGSTVTARGVCWSTSQNPAVNDNKTSNGSGTGSFTSNITGLTANTPYYARAYATNGSGTAYGEQKSFTTSAASGNPCPGIPTVTYSGQTYNTVQIGTQCWFKENLNIGIMIDSLADQTNNGITEKYCYRNLASNCNIYGGIYQWDEMMQYVTTEGTKGICPPEWHLPSDAEWWTLYDSLEAHGTEGGELKSTGTIEAGTGLWQSPNTGATNSSGFTGQPGGFRYWMYKSFLNFNITATFWSSTEYTAISAFDHCLYNNNDDMGWQYDNKMSGFSVRCIKD